MGRRRCRVDGKKGRSRVDIDGTTLGCLWGGDLRVEDVCPHAYACPVQGFVEGRHWSNARSMAPCFTFDSGKRLAGPSDGILRCST